MYRTFGGALQYTAGVELCMSTVDFILMVAIMANITVMVRVSIIGRGQGS